MNFIHFFLSFLLFISMTTLLRFTPISKEIFWKNIEFFNRICCGVNSYVIDYIHRTIKKNRMESSFIGSGWIPEKFLKNRNKLHYRVVIPAKAGIFILLRSHGIPAYAGMTEFFRVFWKNSFTPQNFRLIPFILLLKTKSRSFRPGLQFGSSNSIKKLFPIEIDSHLFQHQLLRDPANYLQNTDRKPTYQ